MSDLIAKVSIIENFNFYVDLNISSDECMLQLAAKLEALRDEYIRFAVEKCSSVLREYQSAVETITGHYYIGVIFY